MDVVETFGNAVDKLTDDNPARGRWLLKTGWEAMNLKFKYLPDRRTFPSDRFLAHMMMDAMLAPLQRPEDAAMVSIFVPCELIQEVGLNPYNVEGFSCYVEASNAEQSCIHAAEDDGIADTLCSYHKTFIGAAQRGLMPKPRLIVYTNVSCDANMLTFRKLSDLFNVPVFNIDVPTTPCEEAVAYVERQMRDLGRFLEEHTGKRIDEDRLRQRMSLSYNTMEAYDLACQLRADRDVPADIVSPLYCAIANNLLLGTPAEATYVSKLLDDVMNAPAKKGKHVYWMHTVPYWSDAVKDCFKLNDRAQIVACELGQVCAVDFDPDKPYEAMARRLVYNSFNGSATRRIQAGIDRARRQNVDGVVWFNHWGCKHTIGASQLAKHMFEEAGFPFLAFDGDGVDKAHGGEGQTATRLEAFLEMIGA